jgi:capsular polysaccharide transport system ATP-binding protein
MIEFRNVSKSFWTGTRRKIILNNVSFRVELGLSLGILASNGTGKTTLINMIAGLEKPDEGQITQACNKLAGQSHRWDLLGTMQSIARKYPKLS